jgi:acylphosphatase
MSTHTQGPAAECWLVRVSGLVQGVGYRAACTRKAQSLGVTGWVRNRFDGSVDAMLHGDADRLTQMRDWLQRGPPGALVEEVQVTRLEPPFPRCIRFEHRPTE